MSDGTTAGTHLITDIQAGSSSGHCNYPFVLGNQLLFIADDGTGDTLWKTDGTAAGTTKVGINTSFSTLRDMKSTDNFASIYGVEIGHTGKAVFWPDISGKGTEPWVTDGTAAGTFELADLYAGSGSSSPFYVCQLGSRRLIFRANVATTTPHGVELCETDGTKAGTRMVTDFYPGFMGGCFDLCVANGKVLFNGNDGGGKGSELYVYDPGATVWKVGSGCGAPPTLWADDPLLGTTQKIYSDNVETGAFGILLLGIADDTPLDLAGCLAHVDILSFFLTIDVWFQAAGGAHQSVLPIPNNLAFKGLRIGMQTWVMPTSNAIGIDMSNGLFEVLNTF